MADTTGHHKKEAFLAAYAECGTVRHAAEAADVARSRHYVWLEGEEYAEAFEQAKDQAAESLVAEARRRARDGVNEPVIYQGKLQGIWVNEKGDQVTEDTPGAVHVPLTIKKYSDTLLIFLLKGALPNTYRERIEHSGDENSPIHVTVKGPPDG